MLPAHLLKGDARIKSGYDEKRVIMGARGQTTVLRVVVSAYDPVSRIPYPFLKYMKLADLP
jgi:hypothetical protein